PFLSGVGAGIQRDAARRHRRQLSAGVRTASGAACVRAGGSNVKQWSSRWAEVVTENQKGPHMKGTSERRRDKRARRVIGAACLLLALVRLAPMVGAPASAAELIPAATAPSEPPIVLPVGMGHLVRFDDPVKSVFLADPSIADLKVVADDLVYLYGKKSGATNLIALDIDKKLK